MFFDINSDIGEIKIKTFTRTYHYVSITVNTEKKRSMLLKSFRELVDGEN